MIDFVDKLKKRRTFKDLKRDPRNKNRISIDQKRRLSDDLSKYISTSLGGRWTQKQLKCLSYLIYSLIKIYRMSAVKKYYLKISLNKNRYCGNKKISYLTVVKCLDALVENGLVEQKRGFYNKRNPSKSFEGNIVPSKLFGKWLNDVLHGFNPENHVLKDKDELLILKDENKNSIEYVETEEIKTIKDKIVKINNHLKGFEYTLDLERFDLGQIMRVDSIEDFWLSISILEYINPVLIMLPKIIDIENFSIEYNLNQEIGYKRVFNKNSFQLGGRWFSSIQRLSEDFRKRIKINGEYVVECDFRACFLNMLYHLEGIEYDRDPYGIEIDSRYRKAIRNIWKKISLTVLNSNSYGIALKSLNYARSKKEIIVDSKYKSEELIENFCSKHELIKEYFFSGIGLKLMSLESKICENIMLRFVEDEKPILSIHDSFITTIENHEFLTKLMIEEYMKLFRFEPKIKGGFFMKEPSFEETNYLFT